MNRVATKKTDNSHFAEKIKIRCLSLPAKKEINILDCFAGKKELWNKIKNLAGSKTINVVSIDKRPFETVLRGDNRKYLKGMNLDTFDVIDLDAYGVPFDQLECIFEKHYEGTVIVTFIQSIYGELPKKLLCKLGYTLKMIKKCPTLFNKDGLRKFEEYLALNGVRKIRIITINRKNYLSFGIKRDKFNEFNT